MGLKHFILFYQLAALGKKSYFVNQNNAFFPLMNDLFSVYGDVLVDYAEKRLEGLPNWIQENVDDVLILQYPYYSQISGAFMRHELKPR